MEQKRIEGRPYTGETVYLDYEPTSFVTCRFVRCKLVIFGIYPLEILQCHVEDCEYVFAGPAFVTLQSLTLLHSQGGRARDAVEMVIDGIRTSRDPEATVQ